MTGGSRIHSVPRQEFCQLNNPPAHAGIGKQHAAQWPRTETCKALQFTTQRGNRYNCPRIDPGGSTTQQPHLPDNGHIPGAHAQHLRLIQAGRAPDLRQYLHPESPGAQLLQAQGQ
jgi:hypothetical protein